MWLPEGYPIIQPLKPYKTVKKHGIFGDCSKIGYTQFDLPEITEIKCHSKVQSFGQAGILNHGSIDLPGGKRGMQCGETNRQRWLTSVGLHCGLWKIYSQVGETKPTLNWREGISRVSETIETATGKENLQLIIRFFKPACVSPAQNMVALYQGFRKINMNQDPTQPPLLQKSCGAKPAGQLRTSTENWLWECTCWPISSFQPFHLAQTHVWFCRQSQIPTSWMMVIPIQRG